MKYVLIKNTGNAEYEKVEVIKVKKEINNVIEKMLHDFGLDWRSGAIFKTRSSDHTYLVIKLSMYEDFVKEKIDINSKELNQWLPRSWSPYR